MDGTTFMVCSQAQPKIALYGPKSSTMENSTCWVTGPALTGKVTSPIDNVVGPLKPDKTFQRSGDDQSGLSSA